MIDIIAHYISHIGEARNCLLDLKCAIEAHSDENMTQSVIAVTNHYKLKNQLSYFILDNIRSNNACIHEILTKLQSDLNSKKHISVVLVTLSILLLALFYLKRIPRLS